MPKAIAGWANTPLLTSLPPEELAKVENGLIPQSYRRGEVLFHENQGAEALFFVIKGAVLLSKSAYGCTVFLGNERAPTILAMIGILDGSSNDMTGTATRECEAALMGRDDVLRTCLQYPEAMNWLLQVCCQRMRLLVSSLELMALGSVRQRLARVLLTRSLKAGAVIPCLDCNQNELARTLGTVREVVFRNLKMMELEGVLHRERRRITIDNFPALRTTAGL